MASTQASLLLQKQLKDLCRHPVDGFSAGLVDESNVLSGVSPDGGFFHAIMSFPPNYPLSPPTVRFTSEIWHPNDDPSGYELASECWSPVHTVESIVLSIVSMLSSPKDESLANVEAAKDWRENRNEFRKKLLAM